MSLRRLFCSRKRMEDGVFTIIGDEAYHGTRVLRLQMGSKVKIFTERGVEFLCTVVATGKGKLVAEVIEKLEDTVEASVQLSLIQALPKAAKLEQIIVHATELGMTRLIPVITERSVAKGERRDRWRRLALEATKQSGRRVIPEVDHVQKLDELNIEQFENSLKLIAAEPPYTGALKQILGEAQGVEEVVLAVGPEGGFSTEEFEWFIESGFKTFSMGPRILRTQTASLAAMSAILYETGDWDTGEEEQPE